MAIHTKLAKKVLTKKEQKHLTEMGINSMAEMKAQVDKMNDDWSGGCYKGCLECRTIGMKLGIWTKAN